MGSRQFGELLLRPSSLRIATIPQTTKSVWHRTPPCLCLSQRSFSNPTKPPSQQDRLQRLAKSHSEDRPQAPPSNRDENQAFDGRFSLAGQPKTKSADASAVIDEMFRSSGVGQSRTSSADDFAAAAARRRFGGNQQSGGNQLFGARFSPKPSLNYRPRGLQVQDMDLPPGEIYDGEPIPATDVPEKDITYPRLNATTGRTVELDVSRGRDIVRGLGMLGSLLARNSVKYDFQKQRFHERPGLKRKRLKSERWRKKFKIGFAATCKRVTELTRKGW